MGDEFSEMVEVWKSNYGLAYNSPEDAMRWWEKATKGWAPAGAVAALGLCLIEIERLQRALTVTKGAVEMLDKMDDDAQTEVERLRALLKTVAGTIHLGERWMLVLEELKGEK